MPEILASGLMPFEHRFKQLQYMNNNSAMVPVKDQVNITPGQAVVWLVCAVFKSYYWTKGFTGRLHDEKIEFSVTLCDMKNDEDQWDEEGKRRLDFPHLSISV